MPYPYYMPYQNQYYTQMQSPVPQTQAPQNAQNSLIWVQGEAGAKSYLTAPNTTVLLMDSEAQRFYLKSTDSSGMPLPLRIFEYAEKTPNSPSNAPQNPTVDYSNFATKAEFDAFKAEIEGIVKPKQTRAVKEAKTDG